MNSICSSEVVYLDFIQKLFILRCVSGNFLITIAGKLNGGRECIPKLDI